jgi:hypothetical protein
VTTPEDDDAARRLRASALIRRGEAAMQRAWFGALTRWLDRTRPSVLGGVSPQPANVGQNVAFWGELMQSEVIPEAASLYARVRNRVLGRDEPVTDAATAQYLNEVGNRLARLPDEVYALIVREVETGVANAESIPDIAARVQRVLTATGSEYWPNRARTVARTETMAAVNAGAYAGALRDAEERGDPAPFKVWLATDDARTRPTHHEADGQRTLLSEPFRVGGAQLLYPGDPRGPAQEVINCVLPDARITGAGIRRAYRAEYSGPAVTLSLSGLLMTVTPNHPVLTEGGWVPACEIRPGDHVLRGFFGGEFPWSQPDVQGDVPTAEEIFDALAVAGNPVRVLRGPVDFHGDVPHGQVEVVSTDRPLVFGVNSECGQEFDQFLLSCAHAPALRGGPSFHLSVAAGDSAHGPVGFSDLCSALRRFHPGPLDGFSLGPATDRDVSLDQPAVNDVPGHFESSGQGVDRLARFVSLDQVLDVQHVTFSGHVYSFETDSGVYLSDTTTSHNCRCTFLPITLGDVLDWTDRQDP